MSDRIKELREKRAKLVHDAREKLDEITEKTKPEDAEEIHRVADAMLDESDALAREAEKLEREQRLARAQEELEKPIERQSGREDRTAAPEASDATGPSYREVFEQAIRYGTGGLDPEARAVLMQYRDSLPPEVRAQATGTDSAGGFVVPDEFSGEIDRAMLAWGPMWDPGISREIVTSTGATLKWPTIDDTANTGRIKAENASVDDDGTDDAVFSEKQLEAYVYDTGMVRVPMELLQDSAFDMQALLTDLFAERLGRAANAALTTGTGTAQPHGVVTAAGVGKTTASGTAIAADELIDLLHSVDPAYRASPSARWMFNDSTLAAIRKLKDGQGNYLWQLGDIRAGEPATILGHPYSINQAMASIGVNNRTVLFGDFSRYVVRKVRSFEVLTLRERYAENFQIGMVAFKRFDGELLNSNAVKALVQAAV